MVASLDAILSPHPSTQPGLPLRLRAGVTRSREGDLLLRFVLEAPVAQIRVPPAVSRPGPKHLLWQHTCFEAFVALEPGGPYHELNLSPSGEWAVYRFSGYREEEALPRDSLAPGIATSASPDRLELTASIPLERLSKDYASAPIHLALCGVVEDAHGGISYFALRHLKDEPDFHQAESFTLRLDPPI